MGWISIKDNTPDKEKDVIVLTKYDVEIGSIWEDGIWYDKNECLLKVTHWMPILKRPK